MKGSRLAGVLLLLVLRASTALAQAPSALTVPSYRVHLQVDEELDPDLLRALARPRTVLWVHTRSNALRASLLERLPLFEESYVELRLPVLESHGAQLQKLPRTGMWLRAEDLGAPTLHRLGIRPLAVELRSALTEEARVKIRSARPARLHWSPSSIPSLAEWGDFAALPGAKVVEGKLLGMGFSQCEAALPETMRRVQVAAPTPPGCGLGFLAQVPADVPDAILSSLSLREPALELTVDIGSSPERARAAVGLLGRLEQARGLSR